MCFRIKVLSFKSNELYKQVQIAEVKLDGPSNLPRSRRQNVAYYYIHLISEQAKKEERKTEWIKSYKLTPISIEMIRL